LGEHEKTETIVTEGQSFNQDGVRMSNILLWVDTSAVDTGKELRQDFLRLKCSRQRVNFGEKYQVKNQIYLQIVNVYN